MHTQRLGDTTKDGGVFASDPDQLNRFVDQHLRRTYLQIYRIVGNESDAQDLTQEAFIKAWQRRGQLRDGERAEAWLACIARNTAIDFLRRKPAATDCGIEELVPAHNENPERILLRAESRATLDTCLRKLTEREHTALVLRDLEGIESGAVAKILGCSKATVRCHIANARAKVRRHLDREELRRSRVRG